MWRFFSLMLTYFLASCGPAPEGDFGGIEPVSQTETTLSLHADGSYLLQFDAQRGPKVTLEGRYSSPDGDALQLQHSRLVVSEGHDVIVSERLDNGALCAPLSNDRELCVSAKQALDSRFEGDGLHISSPPFSFMASQLARR